MVDHNGSTLDTVSHQQLVLEVSHLVASDMASAMPLEGNIFILTSWGLPETCAIICGVVPEAWADGRPA